MSRLVPAALAFVLAAGAISGCSPQPEPEDPPQFASEEEAFAAAEETYRAYVDALNHVDLSDPETFEDVYAWTTGDLNASDRENFSTWHAEGYTKSGDAVIASLTNGTATAIASLDVRVSVEACYDVSEVDVADNAGKSLVSPDRPDVQSLAIDLVGSTSTSTGLALTSINPSSDLAC